VGAQQGPYQGSRLKSRRRFRSHWPRIRAGKAWKEESAKSARLLGCTDHFQVGAVCFVMGLGCMTATDDDFCLEAMRLFV